MGEEDQIQIITETTQELLGKMGLTAGVKVAEGDEGSFQVDNWLSRRRSFGLTAFFEFGGA
jgi:hypothetical protein